MDLPLLSQTPNSSSKLKPILILSLLLLSLLLLFLPSQQSPHISNFLTEDSEFQTFITTFSKSYSSEELPHRFQVFKKNLSFIRLHNSKPSTSIMAINKFSDLTPEEFRSLYSRPRSKSVDPPEIPLPTFNTTLEGPRNVDWRDRGAVTPVKDQGICGSCWAYAAVAAIESAWVIDGNDMEYLSERQLIECSWGFGNDGCQGGYSWNAYDYVIANGGISNQWIYRHWDMVWDDVCDKERERGVVAWIRGKGKVQSYDYVALQNAVARQPVSVSVQADERSWQFYAGGVVTSDCDVHLDHEVLVVGYNTRNEIPYWIVKNSWDTDWGIKGYIHIAITEGKGLCGINLTPGYPIV